MRYFFSGLVAATLVGVSSVVVYGSGATESHPWVEQLFWGLILSGALMGVVGEGLRCKVCSLRERWSSGPAPCTDSGCLAR
jgi:hypothetical protein